MVRVASRLPGSGWLRRRPTRAIYVVVLGGTLLCSGLGMLLSAAVGLLGDGQELLAFAVPGSLTLLAGWAAIQLGRGDPRSRVISPTAGFAAVTLAWGAAAVAGAVPLLLADVFSSPLDATFEAMSGFTTTGATLIDDIDGAPDAVLMWRSVTQWLGGIGIVVLVVAIAPIAGVAIQRVFYAETSAIAAERLAPRIADTAKILALIYGGLSLAAAIAYLLAGMDAFDAVNTAMTTIATGGFSTRSESLAAFDSLGIELVAIAFMLLAGVNFALYWRAARRRPLMPHLAEVGAYAAIAAGAVGVVAVSLLATEDIGVGASLRDAGFTVVSLLTTTGFTTADYDEWNEFARVLLLLLMFVGACAGSTAGGVKVIRAVLLAKTARHELERQTQPTRVRVLRFGGRTYGEDTRNAVLGYFLLYAAVFAVGVLALAAFGLDFVSATGATASTINVVGPGLGDVGGIENFGAVSAPGRAVSIVLMLIGRLELFTVVALLAAIFGAARLRLPGR